MPAIRARDPSARGHRSADARLGTRAHRFNEPGASLSPHAIACAEYDPPANAAMFDGRAAFHTRRCPWNGHDSAPGGSCCWRPAPQGRWCGGGGGPLTTRAGVAPAAARERGHMARSGGGATIAADLTSLACSRERTFRSALGPSYPRPATPRAAARRPRRSRRGRNRGPCAAASSPRIAEAGLLHDDRRLHVPMRAAEQAVRFAILEPRHHDDDAARAIAQLRNPSERPPSDCRRSCRSGSWWPSSAC